MSQRARNTAANYCGQVARSYDEDRRRQVKWSAEDAIVGELIADLERGAHVLDVPVGTGRFLPRYLAQGLRVTGLDINRDMLAVARSKVVAGDAVELAEGNVLALQLADASVDVALCIRLLNMIEPGEMVRALQELQRVARRRVIISLRVGGDPGKLTRPQDVATVIDALLPGWLMALDRPVHKDRYRMIVLERSPPGGLD